MGLSEAAPTLEEIRQRIDQLDAELLRLVDERAGLAKLVARPSARPATAASSA